MNPIIEQKIAAARNEVEKTDAPSERKDGLQAMLDHAHECANGHPDKIGAIAEAMSYLIIHIVRSETRESERIKAAIGEHVTVCKAARVPKTVREFLISVAAQYPILAVLALGYAVKQGWLTEILKAILG